MLRSLANLNKAAERVLDLLALHPSSSLFYCCFPQHRTFVRRFRSSDSYKKSDIAQTAVPQSRTIQEPGSPSPFPPSSCGGALASAGAARSLITGMASRSFLREDGSFSRVTPSAALTDPVMHTRIQKFSALAPAIVQSSKGHLLVRGLLMRTRRGRQQALYSSV
jgi:hypothetical protein